MSGCLRNRDLRRPAHRLAINNVIIYWVRTPISGYSLGMVPQPGSHLSPSHTATPFSVSASASASASVSVPVSDVYTRASGFSATFCDRVPRGGSLDDIGASTSRTGTARRDSKSSRTARPKKRAIQGSGWALLVGGATFCRRAPREDARHADATMRTSSHREPGTSSHRAQARTPDGGCGKRFDYNGVAMSKKPRKKKRTRGQGGGTPSKAKPARYTAGEIAMAILGAAILVMVAGIIITSILD